MRPTYMVLLYSLLTFTNRGMTIFSILLIAHAMEPTAFGIFTFLQLSANMISLITSFNLSSTMAVYLSRGGGTRAPLENAILLLLLFASFSVAALTSQFSLIFLFPRMPILTEDKVWFAIFSGVTNLQVFVNSALLARGRILESAASGSLTALMLVTATLLAGSLSVTYVLKGYALSLCFGVAFSTSILFSNGVLNDAGKIRNSIVNLIRRKGGTILNFSALSLGSSAVFQFALWYLQRELLAIGGGGENAVFSLGNQFYNVILFFPGIVGPLLLRRLSVMTDQYKQAQRALYFGTISCAASIAGLLLFIWLCPFILVILPAKYHIGVTELVLSVAAGGLMFAKFPFSIFFQATVAGRAEFAASVAGAAVLLVGAITSGLALNATIALWVRVWAHLAQALVLIAAFEWQRRTIRSIREASNV